MHTEKQKMHTSGYCKDVFLSPVIVDYFKLFKHIIYEF